MNTIQQHQTQYNNANKTHFKALKGIKYKMDFNPKKYIGDAKAVLEFKKSEAFKDFFQKHDGIAEFERFESATFKNEHSAYLTIRYKEASQAKPETNPLKRGMQKIKRFLSPEKYENDIFYASKDTNKEAVSTKLKDKIKNVSKNDLAQEIEFDKYMAQEKAQKAEELKKLNEEIDRLG